MRALRVRAGAGRAAAAEAADRLVDAGARGRHPPRRPASWPRRICCRCWPTPVTSTSRTSCSSRTPAPSWLTMIDRGATTVWERWEGIDEDGVPHESLNHYSKGAVVSFLHRYVAGLQRTSPTWRTFRVEPRPGGGTHLGSRLARLAARDGRGVVVTASGASHARRHRAAGVLRRGRAAVGDSAGGAGRARASSDTIAVELVETHALDGWFRQTQPALGCSAGSACVGVVAQAARPPGRSRLTCAVRRAADHRRIELVETDSLVRWFDRLNHSGRVRRGRGWGRRGR